MGKTLDLNEERLNKLEQFVSRWKTSEEKNELKTLLQIEYIFLERILAQETKYQSLCKEGSQLLQRKFFASPFVFFRKRPIEDDISDLLAKYLKNKMIIEEDKKTTLGGLLLYCILRKVQDLPTSEFESVKKGCFTVSLRNSSCENIDILIKDNQNDWLIGIENKRDNYEESKGQTKREWKALKEKADNEKYEKIIAIFLDEKNRFPESNEFKRLSYYNLGLALNDLKNELIRKQETLGKNFR